jgi:hypothetical protein
MTWYRTPDGCTVHINFGSAKNLPRPCAARRPDGTICGWIATFQCDWKVPGGTCSRYLCEQHTFEVAGGKHLCPAHVVEYMNWIRECGIAY